MEDLLTSIVKEKGVSKMVLEYKKQMEWGDIINKHNDVWKLIAKDENISVPIDPFFIKNTNK